MLRILLFVLAFVLGLAACSKEDVDEAKDAGKATMDKAGEMADDAVEDAKEMGEAAMDKGKEMVEEGKEMLDDSLNN